MSNSARPHRRQPTRFPCPWNSPGKNTGVGCHFPLQCMKVKNESEVAQACLTLSDPMDCSSPGSSIQDFPGKRTGVGCHRLLLPLLISKNSFLFFEGYYLKIASSFYLTIFCLISENINFHFMKCFSAFCISFISLFICFDFHLLYKRLSINS